MFSRCTVIDDIADDFHDACRCLAVMDTFPITYLPTSHYIDKTEARVANVFPGFDICAVKRIPGIFWKHNHHTATGNMG